MKFLKTLSIVGLALAAPLSHAQTWPARTVTWIVPFAAGGPTDAMARDIAEKVGKQIGQTVIIENAAGAGGTIGATKAARAQPDGYTFLVGHMGYMGAGPSLYKKLNYDPVKSFEAVFRFPDTPLVLLVGPSSPYKNAADLIAAAKANPGKINFGHAGVGSTSHLIAALFASKAGIEVTQVAYKGAAPAMNDLMGGVLQGWQSAEGRYLHLRIYDGDASEPARLLYDSANAAGGGAPGDREMLAASGVRIQYVFILVFAFGAGLAGMAGIVGGAHAPVTAFGRTARWKAFCAGMRSCSGSWNSLVLSDEPPSTHRQAPLT